MFLQQVINGITLGGVYALIALGYTMVYGILGMINFAHGEIYMIGAYLGIIFFTILTKLFQSTFIVMPLVFILAALFCAAFAITMEYIAYRPLRQSHRLAPLISAIGLSIFLQNLILLLQGTGDKVFPLTFEVSSGLEFSGIKISGIQIFIIATSIVLMFLLHLFVSRTKLGCAMRATSQDKKMANLVGINVNHVISATFVIGAMLAGAAGVMVSIYYGSVNFYIGYSAGIKAFTAAVLGGIGSVPGAMLGGLLLGSIESLGAGYISSEYKDAFAFIILILVLIFKPNGLLGGKIVDKI